MCLFSARIETFPPPWSFYFAGKSHRMIRIVTVTIIYINIHHIYTLYDLTCMLRFTVPVCQVNFEWGYVAVIPFMLMKWSKNCVYSDDRDRFVVFVRMCIRLCYKKIPSDVFGSTRKFI